MPAPGFSTTLSGSCPRRELGIAQGVRRLLVALGMRDDGTQPANGAPQRVAPGLDRGAQQELRGTIMRAALALGAFGVGPPSRELVRMGQDRSPRHRISVGQ